MSEQIVITNKRIVDFFSNNKEYDIETLNLFLINYMEVNNIKYSNDNKETIFEGLKKFMGTENLKRNVENKN